VGRRGDKSGNLHEQISYLIYLKLLDEEEIAGRVGESMRETVLLFPQQSATAGPSGASKSGPELRDFWDEVFLLHGFTGER